MTSNAPQSKRRGNLALAVLIQGLGGAEAIAFAAEFAFRSGGAGALFAGTWLRQGYGVANVAAANRKALVISFAGRYCLRDEWHYFHGRFSWRKDCRGDRFAPAPKALGRFLRHGFG